MALEDLAPVAELERQEPSAWQDSLILAELEREESIQLVATINNQVIGWCCSRLVSPEAELLKIAVSAENRRQKISTHLLECLVNHLEESGVQVLFLEVRSHNDAALSFYRHVGFTEVARRIKYYTLPEDDALLLRKDIQSNRVDS
jgi:ribosomal-protein-alanine acetyltransferase